MFTSLAKCAELLANENLPVANFCKEKLTQKVKYLQSIGIVVLSQDESQFSMVINDKSRKLIDYYALSPMIFLDTYTIVLLAMERLCGTKKV